jgi:hypothetical protein
MKLVNKVPLLVNVLAPGAKIEHNSHRRIGEYVGQYGKQRGKGMGIGLKNGNHAIFIAALGNTVPVWGRKMGFNGGKGRRRRIA